METIHLSRKIYLVREDISILFKVEEKFHYLKIKEMIVMANGVSNGVANDVPNSI